MKPRCCEAWTLRPIDKHNRTTIVLVVAIPDELAEDDISLEQHYDRIFPDVKKALSVADNNRDSRTSSHSFKHCTCHA